MLIEVLMHNVLDDCQLDFTHHCQCCIVSNVERSLGLCVNARAWCTARQAVRRNRSCVYKFTSKQLSLAGISETQDCWTDSTKVISIRCQSKVKCLLILLLTSS